jgi:hypothetical protein
MKARRITVRVSNPTSKKRRSKPKGRLVRDPRTGRMRRLFPPYKTLEQQDYTTQKYWSTWENRTRKNPGRPKRRRRNPEAKQGDLFAPVAERQRAKALKRPGPKPRPKRQLRRWKSVLKKPRPAPKSSAPRRVWGSGPTEQLHLDRALESVPRVNRRPVSQRPISVRATSSTTSSPAKKKSKKRSAKTRAPQHRAVRKAARKGGTMAKRRKRRKSSRGRRRIRCIAYTRKGKVVARRVNPGIPAPLAAGLGVLAGAAGGVALSYFADKLGIGSPNARAIGLVVGGAVIGAAGHKFAPGVSTAVGAGVGGIGLLRATQTMLYASPSPSTPVSGLGTGDAGMLDIASAFAQLGQDGVFDRIGEVVQDVGAVYDN